ncbi:hypothetical protein DPEC_G00004470, partial [Dallia pectoralis]
MLSICCSSSSSSITSTSSSPPSKGLVEAPAGFNRVEAPAGFNRVEAPAGLNRVEAPAGFNRGPSLLSGSSNGFSGGSPCCSSSPPSSSSNGLYAFFPLASSRCFFPISSKNGLDKSSTGVESSSSKGLWETLFCPSPPGGVTSPPNLLRRGGDSSFRSVRAGNALVDGGLISALGVSSSFSSWSSSCWKLLVVVKFNDPCQVYVALHPGVWALYSLSTLSLSSRHSSWSCWRVSSWASLRDRAMARLVCCWSYS